MTLGFWFNFGKKLDQNKNDGNVISTFKTDMHNISSGLNLFSIFNLFIDKISQGRKSAHEEKVLT